MNTNILQYIYIYYCSQQAPLIRDTVAPYTVYIIQHTARQGALVCCFRRVFSETTTTTGALIRLKWPSLLIGSHTRARLTIRLLQYIHFHAGIPHIYIYILTQQRHAQTNRRTRQALAVCVCV